MKKGSTSSAPGRRPVRRRPVGTFHVGCRVENTVDRLRAERLPRLLVDTGSEYTWVPARVLEKLGIAREKKDAAFVMVNGQQITRSVGFAILRVGRFFTVDEVVFAGAHNSMSAAELPGWMFPNQELASVSLLNHGIRALLFDVHNGVPIGGTVRTEIADEAASRAKFEKAIGKEGKVLV